MPSEMALNIDKAVPTLMASSEKPVHYHYLREFRAEPCAQFKQHQCQQHRPYTCFYWHFANQRRRRPTRRKDGTFNYSPDIYCTKYDENSGVCPDSDECPFLHRVAGDVERKYHLRYFKTSLCVHGIDVRGQCSKNGQHCAFAHNAADLRAPVFDIRELQHSQGQSSGLLNNMATVADGLLLEQHKERTSFAVEDSIWQDQEHVLACYKTEPCKKPPRLCRQGYACPYYHNSKDRRRPPGIFKYRSTPCPSAKSADEWADPDGCENGDHCQYCHTRTEQQFHPEIFKSTKCNDMLQHGYCPRGPFCAFAHNDAELRCERRVRKPPALIASASGSPPELYPFSGQNPCVELSSSPLSPLTPLLSSNVSLPEAPLPPTSFVDHQQLIVAPSYSAVLKQRQQGVTAQQIPSRMSGVQDTLSNSYPKAPGFERGQFSVDLTGAECLDSICLFQPTRTWTPDVFRTRTTSLTMGHLDLGCTVGENTPPTPNSLHSQSFSPYTIRPLNTGSSDSSHRPPSGFDEQLNFDELTLATITEQREDQHCNGEVSKTRQSVPVRIPGSSLFGSSSSPVAEYPFQTTICKIPSPSSHFPTVDETVLMVNELQKAREELAGHRTKLLAWEEGLKQARQACEAWKKDAEMNRRFALQAEADRNDAVHQRDLARSQLEQLRSEVRCLQSLALGQLNSSANNGNSNENNNIEAMVAMGQVYASLKNQLPSPPICGRCGRQVNMTGNANGCPVCSIKNITVNNNDHSD